MTDQERLAEIKAQYHILTRNGYDLGAWDEPFSWLIERVQELENLENAFDDLDSDYIDLQQENERYRERIECILAEAKDHKRLGLKIHHWALIKDLEKALEGTE